MMTTETDINEALGLAPGKNRMKKYLYWAVALVLLLSVLGFWIGKQRAAAANTGMRYRTEAARTGDLNVTVTATGQLKPTHTVDVGSQVSGIMDEVLVQYNEHVKVGQVLARVNTQKLDAQVLQDKAQLQSARAKVEDAKVTVTETDAEYKRMLDARQRSTKNQIVSQHDLDTAKAAYDRAVVSVTTAEASVTQAEANLQIDETNVAFAVIKSPVDGIVLSRGVEPGQTIAASFQVATLFEIAEDLRKMRLEVNIDEADVGQVKEGQKVLFTVDAYPGRQFPGTITRLRYSSTTSNNVVTYLAEISVENDQLLLRPGMTATATITVQSLKSTLLVPNHALRFLPSQTPEAGRGMLGRLLPAPPGMNGNKQDDSSAALNRPRVWVVRNNEPVAIPVSVGSTDGHFTEVKSGDVTPGMPLIVEALKDSK